MSCAIAIGSSSFSQPTAAIWSIRLRSFGRETHPAIKKRKNAKSMMELLDLSFSTIAPVFFTQRVSLPNGLL
jgi:hypothetical protein